MKNVNYIKEKFIYSTNSDYINIRNHYFGINISKSMINLEIYLDKYYEYQRYYLYMLSKDH